MCDSHIYSPATPTKEVFHFLPGLLANNEMAQRFYPALSNPYSEKVQNDGLLKWDSSAAHSILARSISLQQRPYTFAQTNPSLHFSLAARRRTIHSEWRAGAESN
jgi:hypothetical protein